MAQPANPVDRYDVNTAVREDLIDKIYNTSPTETPVLSAVGRVSATNTYHEWQRDALATANKDNALIDGDDVTLDAQTATERAPHRAGACVVRSDREAPPRVMQLRPQRHEQGGSILRLLPWMLEVPGDRAGDRPRPVVALPDAVPVPAVPGDVPQVRLPGTDREQHHRRQPVSAFDSADPRPLGDRPPILVGQLIVGDRRHQNAYRIGTIRKLA